MKNLFVALAMLSAVACGQIKQNNFGVGGGDGGTPVAPKVTSVTPANGASNVAVDSLVSAAFSEPMVSASINAVSFTVEQDSAGSVSGAVSLSADGKTATFLPAAALANNASFIATITIAATATNTLHLAAPYVWHFSTIAAIPNAPQVVAVTPSNGSVGVSLSAIVSASFDKVMDPGTVEASFSLSQDSVGPVAGVVSMSPSGKVATFAQTNPLAANASFTATIGVGATSAGIPLAVPYIWHFQTGSGVVVCGSPVDLGTAGNFVILAKSGISTVPNSAITGDIGVSPIDQTALTGFSQTMDPSNQWSTSAQVTGKLYAADYAPPTPTNMTTAISDMETAFSDAAGRAPDATELGAGDISGMTLPAGVYKWSTGLLINTDVTLSGSACDVWIFEVAEDMTVASGVIVHLTGGAVAKNVFWQVSGHTTLGTTVQFQGVILDQTMINLRTNASIVGRLMAQTQVTLESNVVTQPAP